MISDLTPTVVKARATDILDTVEFAMKVRSEVFPMLDPDVIPVDLLNFEKYYMQPDSAFFIALSKKAGIVGSIGVIRYDNRFNETLGFYDGSSTAEIVKCYVDPSCRRSGIGSMLVQSALQFMKDTGFKMAYLHTHRFLPGAVSFWQGHGFTIQMELYDDWQTVHMDRQVSKAE